MKALIFNWLGKMPYGQYLQNNYVLAILILIGSAILAKVILFIFERYLEKLAKKTKTEVDDIIFDRTKRPIFYLILAYGLKLAMYTLQINGWVSKLVNTLMAIVFVFILARVLDVVIEVWGKTVAKKTKSKIDDVLLPLFHKASRVTFIIIGVLWTLKVWEIDIGPYLAGAGILGVVLGFALQDSLKNIFGGVTLLLDKTFEIGDKIKLESGDLGEVLDVGLRSTKIRTYDNELIYVPNGYLANSRVQNFTRPNRKLRVSVDFGVQYGSKIKDVQKVIIPVLQKIKTVMKDPLPAVHFREMGESSLNFRAYIWVENWQDGYSTKLEATESIYAALNKAKIGIPFPTRTVYVKKEK